MSKPGTYVPFEICFCGKSKRTVHQAPDKKFYYGCGYCGRTSIRYREDTEYKAKFGWNAFIEKERRIKKIYEQE